MNAFNGLGVNLSNLHRLSGAKTRSISPESFTGEKGKAGMATDGTGSRAARPFAPSPSAGACAPGCSPNSHERGR